jgi:hypothetical protein
MSTLTAPRQGSLHRPRTSTLVITGVIVVILAAAAVFIPRLLSTSTTTVSAPTVTYAGGGGGNGSHSHPGHNAAPGFASAVAAEQVVAMQQQYLDGLLFRQSRLVDQGTPQASVSLKALGPQIAAAQQSLTKAEAAAKVAKPQPEPHTQN